MNSKAALAGVALIAVLGIGVILQSVAGGDDAPAADPGSAPTRAATLGTQPTDTPSSLSSDPAEPEDTQESSTNEHDVAEPQVIAAAADVATSAIKAYTQYSYLDDSQTSWIDRVVPYATSGFHHALVEQFGVKDPYWDQEVVPNRRQTRTEVTGVVVDGMHKQTPTAQVYTVTFETSLKTKDMSDWGDADPVTMWVFLDKDGSGWKVSDITGTDDRS